MDDVSGHQNVPSGGTVLPIAETKESISTTGVPDKDDVEKKRTQGSIEDYWDAAERELESFEVRQENRREKKWQAFLGKLKSQAENLGDSVGDLLGDSRFENLEVLTSIKDCPYHREWYKFLEDLGVPMNSDVTRHTFSVIYGMFYEHYSKTCDTAEMYALRSIIKGNVEVDLMNMWGQRYLRWDGFGVFFDVIIMLVVVGNAVEIYISTNDVDGKYAQECHIASHGFSAFFVLEFIIRIWAMKSLYFKFKHNIVDLALALSAVLDTWLLPLILDANDGRVGSLSALRMVRLLRVMRLAKLVRRIRPVWTLMRSMHASLLPLLGALALMLISLLAFSIFLVQIIGHDEDFGESVESTEDPDTLERLLKAGGRGAGGDLSDVKQRFQTVEVAMLTLFGCVTDGCHDTVFGPLVTEMPIMMLFVVFFVAFMGFGLLNILVGVFCDTSVRATQEFDGMMSLYHESQKRSSFYNVAKLWFLIDTECQGYITEEMLVNALRDPSVCCLLQDLGLEDVELHDLYRGLDQSNDGFLTIEEFMRGLLSLRHGGSSQVCAYLMCERIEHKQMLLNKRLVKKEATLIETIESLKHRMDEQLNSLEKQIAEVSQEGEDSSNRIEVRDDMVAMLCEMHGLLKTRRKNNDDQDKKCTSPRAPRASPAA